MKLSTQEWKSVSIKDGAEGQSNAVRMQRVVGSYAEKLAVLELQTAVPDARSVAIRMLPLMPEDRVVTVAYPNDRLNTVVGRFVQYADTGKLAGTALLEIFKGENRLVIDYGASGAPVFDCEGRVAAVISTVITQILSTPFGNRRVSTAWGSPNVVSIPIQQLIEFSKAQSLQLKGRTRPRFRAIADMHQLTVLDATTLRAAALLHNVAALCALPTLT